MVLAIQSFLDITIYKIHNKQGSITTYAPPTQFGDLFQSINIICEIGSESLTSGPHHFLSRHATTIDMPVKLQRLL